MLTRASWPLGACATRTRAEHGDATRAPWPGGARAGDGDSAASGRPSPHGQVAGKAWRALRQVARHRAPSGPMRVGRMAVRPNSDQAAWLEGRMVVRLAAREGCGTAASSAMHAAACSSTNKAAACSSAQRSSSSRHLALGLHAAAYPHAIFIVTDEQGRHPWGHQSAPSPAGSRQASLPAACVRHACVAPAPRIPQTRARPPHAGMLTCRGCRCCAAGGVRCASRATTARRTPTRKRE
jgi:hypothetical protein